ncbi:hypothetical protein ACFC0R_42700 [Streptomyces sp. NPDC056086]|uniref:hypothetical protein n=1 Tax=Streptomyces sp. NPDC056086 TaxID=3345709 RepID=UPI0035E1BD43
MADADSILASLERVTQAVLAIKSVANAAQGDSPMRQDLAAELAFGFYWMADRAVDQVELVKTMVRELRDEV